MVGVMVCRGACRVVGWVAGVLWDGELCQNVGVLFKGVGLLAWVV